MLKCQKEEMLKQCCLVDDIIADSAGRSPCGLAFVRSCLRSDELVRSFVLEELK